MPPAELLLVLVFAKCVFLALFFFFSRKTERKSPGVSSNLIQIFFS